MVTHVGTNCCSQVMRCSSFLPRPGFSFYIIQWSTSHSAPLEQSLRINYIHESRRQIYNQGCQLWIRPNFRPRVVRQKAGFGTSWICMWSTIRPYASNNFLIDWNGFFILEVHVQLWGTHAHVNRTRAYSPLSIIFLSQSFSLTHWPNCLSTSLCPSLNRT